MYIIYIYHLFIYLFICLLFIYLFILNNFFLFPPSKRRESKSKRINGSFRFRLFGRILRLQWACDSGRDGGVEGVGIGGLPKKTEALNHLGCEKVQENA